MDLAQFWYQAGGLKIDKSVRFRGAQGFTRTSPDGNKKTWTRSVWIKRNVINEDTYIASLKAGTHVEVSHYMYFNPDNTLSVEDYYRNGARFYYYKTTETYTDTNKWYHVHFVMDATNATSGDRGRLYVNGVRIAQNAYTIEVPENNDGWIGLPGYVEYLGRGTIFGYGQSLMAEHHFVDGQALEPTSFGTGTPGTDWWPKKYTGSHGPGGWYCDFSDPANIGADRSGNGLNWTPQGLQLTNPGASDYDWINDGPP